MAHTGDAAVTPALHKRTLLLVEPDRATRQLYARELVQEWHVTEAATVDEARNRLAGELPAVVVLEPYAAGLAAEINLQRAWQLLHDAAASNKSLRFVICSVVDERRTAYALGAALYLLKPVSPHQLLSELQRLLGPAVGAESEATQEPLS